VTQGTRVYRAAAVIGCLALLGVGPALRVPNAPAAHAATAGGCQPTFAGWTPEQKLRQLAVVGFNAKSATATPARLATLARGGYGGFMVLGNYPTTDSLAPVRARMDAIQTATAKKELRPFLAVDEEGGAVQRLRALGTLPSAREFGKQTPSAITKTMSAHAAKVKQLGFNIDFGPVLDLDDRSTGVIATRSFGTDPVAVWASANAYATGLSAGGLLPVFKHFPGHGTADGDSHKLLPKTKPLTTLEKGELLVFQQAVNSGARMIMVGHLIVPGLSTNATTPTSTDPATYKLLRSMKFDGVAITDALDMQALEIHGDTAGRAMATLNAGADLYLMGTPDGVEKVVAQLAANVKAGKLSAARVDESLRRVVCLKQEMQAS
jgi:beta-N-acetylhexosaminidase